MNLLAKKFEDNKFVILKDVLSKEQCSNLTNYLFEQHSKGKLHKDEQCKLSDSIYGDPVLEDILQISADSVSKMIGKKLLPTYCYARIYRSGEVLDAHVDRSACEISVTVTLGTSGKKVWPIYFDNGKETKANLPIGTGAVYRGTEVTHWRNKFEGEWQAQMFLHYVDADGPHKDEYKDRRKNFGEKKVNIIETRTSSVWPFTLDHVNQYAFWTNGFTKQECEEIIRLGTLAGIDKAVVQKNEQTCGVNEAVRKSEVSWIHPNQQTEWIYRKITDIVMSLNNSFFKFDLFGLTETLQFTKYTAPDGNYDKHTDAAVNMLVRKLSFTLQLSDPKDYEGGDLLLHIGPSPAIMEKKQGEVSVFPSYTLHEVTPVTKGTRYSLVAWVTGKPFV